MSKGYPIYLYRPTGTFWCCDLSDLRSCLGLATDRGWRPVFGDPSSYFWGCYLEIGADDATTLTKTLELALAEQQADGPNSDRAAKLLGSGSESPRTSVLRDLIDFCRQGEFFSVDDEFPTLSTRGDVLQHAREVAEEVTVLSFAMAVTGCSGNSLCDRRYQLYRALNAMDHYLGGDHVERVVQHIDDAYATEDPVRWQAFVEGDHEKLAELREQAAAEEGHVRRVVSTDEFRVHIPGPSSD